MSHDATFQLPRGNPETDRRKRAYLEMRLQTCASPKLHPACIFNNFIRLLAVRTGDVVLQLQRSRSLLPTPAAALPSAQAHPWRATNGSVTGDNIRNNFSKCGANGFRLGQSHDRDTRDESNRLFFPRMDFAKASGRLLRLPRSSCQLSAGRT